MIDLILRGPPWTAEEQTAILDYCQSDVEALRRLLPAMLPRIDLPRALLRGRYMCAVAAIGHNGIPIDSNSLARLRQHWPSIQRQLIRHAPIHRRSGHSDIAICCGRNVRGSSPSTSVVPLSNQVTTLNHKRFKGFKMFSDGH